MPYVGINSNCIGMLGFGSEGEEGGGGKDPCMGTMRPTLTRATRCHIVHSANINCMFMHGWIIGDASVMVVAVVAWLEEGADGQDKDPCIIMCRTYN